MVSFLKIVTVFEKYDFENERIITYDKEEYTLEHPLNKVALNGNIFIFDKEDQKFVKIWWGDIDISLEGETLKKIAAELGTTLYVVEKEEGFGEKTTNQNILEVAVWDTEKPTPFVEQKVHEEAKVEKEQQEDAKMKILLAKHSAEKNTSESLPVVEPKTIFDMKIVDTIAISENELNIFFRKLAAKAETDMEELEGQGGYFTLLFANELLDHILVKKFGEGILEKIKLSQLWINEEFNTLLNTYNMEFDKLFFDEEQVEKAYKTKNPSVTSSYVHVIRYEETNELGYSNKSFKNLTIYILEDYLK